MESNRPCRVTNLASMALQLIFSTCLRGSTTSHLLLNFDVATIMVFGECIPIPEREREGQQYISRNFNFIYIYLTCIRSFILFVSIELQEKSYISQQIIMSYFLQGALENLQKSMRSVLLFPTIDQLVDMELLTLLAEKNATFNRA